MTVDSHLHRVQFPYIEHYNNDRNHQGQGVQLRAPNDDPNVIASPAPSNRIRHRTATEGLINKYRHAA